MRTTAALFDSWKNAETAANALNDLLPQDRVMCISRHDASKIKEVPTTDDMAPVAAPMGASLGGALGAGAVLMIPGFGLAAVVGAAAAGVVGAAGGWLAGKKADEASSSGLPKDEVFVYKNELEEGKSLVVALIEDESLFPRARDILTESGAVSIDPARDQWTIKTRNA